MGSELVLNQRSRQRSTELNHAGQFLSPIDKITLFFCLWMIVYMLIGTALGRANQPEIHLPAYVSIFTGVLLLAWVERNLTLKPRLLKALQFIRGIYPVLLFGYFYTSLHSVTLILFGEWLDPWFMRIDLWIFGYYPSLVWGQKYSGMFLQEFFHFAYFCYYPMIAGLPVYLYFKNKPAFRELIFNLTLVFYACYFIYSLVPVIGGRYFPEAYQLAHAYRFGPFTHIMAFIYNHSGHWGGAFPSSHIAVTLVLTMAALKYVRKWGYVFCVISFFLSLATVYCHYHWFIDAVAGVLTGILGYHAANYVRGKLQRENQ
jgi:membrane-associated phospholipid phosphatase